MSKIRIVSTGHGRETRVLDSRGDVIDNVTSVVIDPIVPDKFVTATITVRDVELDVDAEVDVA